MSDFSRSSAGRIGETTVRDPDRTAGSGSQEPEIGGGLSIRDVSRLLSVPAPTIRSWERRYGVPLTPRSAGGHRRYSAAEVITVRRMRDEIARGRRAADAAVLVRQADEPGEPQQSLITAFLQAAQRGDPAGTAAALEQATEGLGEAAMFDVLFPAMRQVGAWWEAGRCDLGAERLATEAARTWLRELLIRVPAPWHRGSIILTCGPRDQHTLAQEAMRVVLARRGWASRLLGPRTPAAALLTAVRLTGAPAVVVVSHLSVGRRAAIESLRAAELAGPRLFYAGNAFLAPASRAGVPGSYLGEDLPAAADVIAAALLAERPVAADFSRSQHAALS